VKSLEGCEKCSIRLCGGGNWPEFGPLKDIGVHYPVLMKDLKCTGTVLTNDVDQLVWIRRIAVT
jgi:hypothetical protein